MNARKQKDEKPIALEAYETLAEQYAALVDSKAENAYCERPATLSLLPDVRGKRVLDAGCGPGSYSEWLVIHGAIVVSLDISPKMVELARQRLGTRAEIHQADLNKPLDFLRDGQFEIVLCPLVLDYIEDWHNLFTEFCRVLAEPGLLIFSIGHPFTEFILRSDANYFDTELVHTKWRGFGIRVNMPSFRRPLSAVTSTLDKSGFTVDKLVETQPLEELREIDPQTYELHSRRPAFLCIRARRKQ